MLLPELGRDRREDQNASTLRKTSWHSLYMEKRLQQMDVIASSTCPGSVRWPYRSFGMLCLFDESSDVKRLGFL